MAGPSNLKVRRLDELDALPAGTHSDAYLYAVHNNHDYKVTIDAIAADLEDAIYDSLSTDEGAAMVGYKYPASGSVTRPVQDRLGDEISVKDFAVGDGVVDDSAGLEAFFAALKSTGKKGVGVPGTFRITRRLLLTGGNVRLEGRGMHIMIPDGLTYGDTDTTGAAAIDFLDMDSLELSGMRFTTASTNGCSIIHVRGTSNVRIYDNEFNFTSQSVGSKCIIVSRGPSNTRQVRGVIIRDNILNPGGSGILVIGNSTIRPRGVMVQGNNLNYSISVSDAGIKMDKWTHAFVVSGNTIAANDLLTTGIAVEKSSNAGIVTGNSLYGCYSRGISLSVDPDEGSVPLYRLLIHGNMIDRGEPYTAGSSFGINIVNTGTSSHSVVLSNNYILGYNFGIREVDAGISDLTITGNTLTGINTIGMDIRSNGVVIANNVVKGATGVSGYSLSCLGTPATIVNNSFLMTNTTSGAAVQQSVADGGTRTWVFRNNVGLMANTITMIPGNGSIKLGAQRYLLNPAAGVVNLTLGDAGLRDSDEIELVQRASTNSSVVSVAKLGPSAAAGTITMAAQGNMVRLVWNGHSWLVLNNFGATIT